MKKGIKKTKREDNCPECGKELTPYDCEPYCPEDGGIGMPYPTPTFTCENCGYDDSIHVGKGLDDQEEK